MIGHLKMKVGSGKKILLNGKTTLPYYSSRWNCPELQISHASENLWEVLHVIIRTSVLNVYYMFIVSRMCFKRNHSPGLRRYKLRRVKDLAYFISSSLKIVKRIRRRQYDPVLIKRTIGLVIGPSTTFYRQFLKDFNLNNKEAIPYDGPCPNVIRGDRVFISFISNC